VKRPSIWFALILIASALLLSAVNGSSQSAQNLKQPQPSQDREQYQGVHPSPYPTAINDQIKASTAAAASKQKENASKDKMSCYDILSLIAQYLIFVATVIYAVFAGWTLRAISRQTRAAIKALRISNSAARAARESADAASKNARTAELAFYTSTRPWVIVSDFTVTAGRMIYYRIYNAGPTPAIVTGIYIHSMASPVEPDRNAIDPSLEATERIAIPIPPNTSRTEGFNLRMFKPEIAKADWDQIEKNEKFLYCYGFIKYIGPLDKDFIYDTGFGAWHQGLLHLANGHAMEPLAGYKINFFR
jgi:hypothetical protein